MMSVGDKRFTLDSVSFVEESYSCRFCSQRKVKVGAALLERNLRGASKSQIDSLTFSKSYELFTEDMETL